jgi:hypothetical protein
MQRADKRKYHYIYKITRDDGRYYIGMHSTDDLDDGYFGSGKLITRSVRKHGKERHSREILELLPTRPELRLRESELLTEEIRNDPKCMNLAPGGGGGFKDAVHQRKATIAGLKSPNRNQSAAVRKAHITRKLRGIKNFGGNQGVAFKGRKHSDETKNKMSSSHHGKHCAERNSQYGTYWITNGTETIKIKKDEFDEYANKGYWRGRTTKCKI